jgi:hypothetical protein
MLSATDRIVSASAAISGDDDELTVDHIDTSDTTAKIWLTGGTAGVTYTVKASIVSNEGRRRTLKLKVSVLDPNS